MATDESYRARLALAGLSVGDAYGQRFFFPGVVEQSDRNTPPPPPWYYTDDTEMAMAIVEVLEQRNAIDQDALAQKFAERFAADPGRGYGGGAFKLLKAIDQGADWRQASRAMFGGQGSFGNGGAMRVAPLGAWFANDVGRTIEQARLSAEVTHAHPEGQMGAVAIALAAGWAWQRAHAGKTEDPRQMLAFVLEHLDDSEVREGVETVAAYPLDEWAFTVAGEVGCGHRVIAQDTVPFCLWMAAAHLDDFREALWVAACVGGDVDTTCAIIGGIVALSVGSEGIPGDWLASRECLKW